MNLSVLGSFLGRRARAWSGLRRCATTSLPANPRGRMYPESENGFAHGYMEGRPAYSETVVGQWTRSELARVAGTRPDLRDVDWARLPADLLCQRFREVSVDAALKSHLPISDDRYSEMCRRLVDRLGDMSDDQLADVLRSLNLWPMTESANADNFHRLWKELDRVCLARRKSWTLDRTLYFIDLWYSNRLTKMSDFVFESMRRLAKKADRLTATQLVQMLFYLNAIRNTYRGISMFDLESRLEELSDGLTIEELGVAAMAFFKTKCPVRSDALQSYVVSRLIDEIGTVPEIALTSIVKMLRMSLAIELWPMMGRLLDALVTRLDGLSIKSCAHIALLSTRSQALHRPMLEKVSKRLVDNIHEARLKDIEKILFALMTVNYVPESAPDVFDRVVAEIGTAGGTGRRKDEFVRYPRCLVAIVQYLSMRSLFCHDAVAVVLDMNFIRQTYGKSKYMIGREILLIDTCIEMECPDYKGARLPEEIRDYLCKRHSCYLPDPKRRMSKHESFVWELMEAADVLLGKEFVACKYILPHNSRADLVLRVDSGGNPMVIPGRYRESADFAGGPLRPVPESPDEIWKVVVPLSRNMYLYDRPDLPNGETLCKLRHLALLGYHPILVTLEDWPSGKAKRLQQVDYLKRKIFQ